MRFKRSFTEAVPKRRENKFAKAGIAAFHGRARFATSTTVKVVKRRWSDGTSLLRQGQCQ
jgi:glutathione reductase (NADPH)